DPIAQRQTLLALDPEADVPVVLEGHVAHLVVTAVHAANLGAEVETLNRAIANGHGRTLTRKNANRPAGRAGLARESVAVQVNGHVIRIDGNGAAEFDS